MHHDGNVRFGRAPAALALIVVAAVFFVIYLKRESIGRLDRATVVDVMAVASGLAAILSVWLALSYRTVWTSSKKPWGYVLLAFWVLVPPIWFMTEYSFWPPDVWGVDDERVRHLHDLGRNIWIAFVAILAVLLDVKIKLPGGD